MKPQYIENQGMLIDGNFWLVHPQTGENWDEKSILDYIETYAVPDDVPQIEQQKQEAVHLIKQQSGQRIEALDWKVQRARDRIARAELGGEAQISQLEQAEAQLLAVLQEREAIREQSDQAEQTLSALQEVEAVNEFTRQLTV